MNAALSPQTYIAKAEADFSGARLLLNSGETDGALWLQRMLPGRCRATVLAPSGEPKTRP